MPIKNVLVNAVQVEGFKVEARSRELVSYVDQPPAAGGTDAGPTPLEYLFISLAGCIVTIGTIIARQKRMPVRRIDVTVKGEKEPFLRDIDVRCPISDNINNLTPVEFSME